jgi:non-specific serine/threonine protein kinase
LIDKQLAHYEITAMLGKGGMGEVYRARDTKLGREVAIKLLPASMANDRDRLARFEQEARTVASLNHPNVVTLFSIENEGDTRFLTMELVEGKGLDHHLTPGGLPVERVVELGITIADALSAAHENGIVHRDLKPANVMIADDGTVKVLDFGIAKLEQSGDDDSMDAATVAAITGEGQVSGTIPYMAPEQLRGEAVDNRTDLFSLGILLHELVTSRRPFAGESSIEISAAILRDTPTAPSAVRTDVPADLDRIISRCLEKDPDDRYQSAHEVVKQLRHVGHSEQADLIHVAPPAPSTPLLGREDDLERAKTRLEAGARLLTVSGYGGTGKTRFSIEIFRRLAHGYDGGAAFVSLASVTDATEVLPTISTAMDIAEAHGRTAIDALATVIGQRRVLLILDNLEQVLDAAEDIAALIARCPALQVIATSRAPLKVGAEVEFALPPLALPEPGDRSLEYLLACPSVALFVQRAKKVKQDFELTDENSEAVTGICRQLDGLPLALELAAARVRILEPARLLHRLDHALDLLTSGDRDLPMRQRTLRATISWSYSLLDVPEQQLLRRCSVFHEGWTFEAMEQVCYADDEQWRALDELESLVEKGLVRVVGSGERYALLETIRAFSAEQLHAGGEVETIRDAHAKFFVGWTAEMAAEFRGTGQVPAVRRIRTDNANELAAIHWLTVAARDGDQEALENAMLLCGQLDWFWHVTGLHNTAQALVEDVLELAGGGPPSRGRALASLAAAMVSITTGEIERSLQEWTAGYEDGLAIGDDEIAAEGCMGMGYVHLSSGRLENAMEPIDRALELSRNGTSEFMYSLSLAIKGMLVFQAGEQDAGMKLAGDALRIQQRQKDCEGGGIALSFLASMNFARGDLEQARRFYAEALATFEEVGDRPEIARVYCETGWSALADDDPRAARDAFRRAVHAYEEVGSVRGTGLGMLGLAAVEAAEGRAERAVVIAEAAQALAERAGVVCDHPMDPGVVQRIEALKVSIPTGAVDGIVANASELTPAAVLALVSQADG